jgi:hypothetical protein
VRILQGAISDRAGWQDWFLRMYKAADSFSDTQRRTAANMLAYLAARLDLDIRSLMRRLLEEESDPMLQNSLAWALARLGVEDTTWSWFLRLNDEQELASLNRGYLLYYFGDLKQSVPPYRDEPPYIDCTHTRAKLFEKLSDDASERPPARKAVDLFSYLDLLTVRDEKMQADERNVVQKFVETLYARVDEQVRRILDEKVAKTV